MKRSILAVWLLCCLSLMAGSKKDEAMVVQFNLQGAETDGPKMSVPQEVLGMRVYFRLSPEISTRDIESFRPFPAADGYSYGVLFKLNRTGAQRLAALTNANQGKLLMSRVNGRPLDVVEIDSTVNDGYIVIWQGLTTREIGMADKMMPRIGQSVQEWKKQKK
ncbi:hypothetical protein [Roseibacillus persicicus]|uniref:DUF4367 domain-containing protein n=1 Tax=Roseibacillus persicicus TaxID=454148 RepID=A0A918WP94_9BACT|nr:hypothetical protein [Roseibacillus persicicus]MDQ8188688.1 hypothetical protein [Roseibacillus persicicus]GHC63391.1 hypothetical protein GCM10007100_33730 [Roseibacillus persicicus]